MWKLQKGKRDFEMKRVVYLFQKKVNSHFLPPEESWACWIRGSGRLLLGSSGPSSGCSSCCPGPVLRSAISNCQTNPSQWETAKDQNWHCPKWQTPSLGFFWNISSEFRLKTILVLVFSRSERFQMLKKTLLGVLLLHHCFLVHFPDWNDK